MATENVRLYEGMFLINPTKIASNLNTATQLVRELLERVNAEIISIARWDERKLAYEIRGAKRGLYMLAYFKVDGRKVVQIERDVNLSEGVLRCLIIRADHVGDTELELARQEQEKTVTAARLQGEAKPEAAEPAEAHAEPVGAGADQAQ
jgi:small subunit ribosomal protein S6